MKDFRGEVADRLHVPPQRQLHCSLLMLPFKLGHVTQDKGGLCGYETVSRQLCHSFPSNG